jgi:molybdopterin-guanine dinucleotide biosynthesis protein A
MNPVGAYILAGGRSTRMGQDKALLRVGGQTLLESTLSRLRREGFSPRLAGGAPELARFATLVPDREAGCGPLSGVDAGLAASEADLNLFVAVDLPCLADGLLSWLVERAQRSGAWATIPSVGGRPQPLCAVYHRDLKPGIEAALDGGSYQMMAALQQASRAGGGCDLFALESVRAAEGGRMDWLPPMIERVFLNCNTPRDLERAREWTPGCADATAERLEARRSAEEREGIE